MSILLLTHCALSLQPSAEAASPWELPQGALTLGGQWETSPGPSLGVRSLQVSSDQRWGLWLSAELSQHTGPTERLEHRISRTAPSLLPEGERGQYFWRERQLRLLPGVELRLAAEQERLFSRAGFALSWANAPGMQSDLEQISNIEVDLTGSLHAGPWLGLGARGHRDSLYYEHLLVAQWLSPLVGVGGALNSDPSLIEDIETYQGGVWSTRDFLGPELRVGLHSVWTWRVLALQLQAGGVERRRSQSFERLPYVDRSAYESGTGWGHYLEVGLGWAWGQRDALVKVRRPQP